MSADTVSAAPPQPRQRQVHTPLPVHHTTGRHNTLSDLPTQPLTCPIQAKERLWLPNGNGEPRRWCPLLPHRQRHGTESLGSWKAVRPPAKGEGAEGQ